MRQGLKNSSHPEAPGAAYYWKMKKQDWKLKDLKVEDSKVWKEFLKYQVQKFK